MNENHCNRPRCQTPAEKPPYIESDTEQETETEKIWREFWVPELARPPTPDQIISTPVI